jgi:hypothetical protein
MKGKTSTWKNKSNFFSSFFWGDAIDLFKFDNVQITYTTHTHTHTHTQITNFILFPLQN